MSFQVSSTDLKHGTEIKESVATAEEEFKNSTAGETDRKLVPEDEEEFKNSRDEETEIKLVPEDEDEEEQSSERSGLHQKRRKRTHRYFSQAKERHIRFSAVENSTIFYKEGKDNPPYFRRGIRPTINPYLENKDEDEDKEISRTQSMDNLLLMQKPQHQSQ